MRRKVEPRSRLFQRRLKRDECYATPSERSRPSYAIPPTSQENVDGTSERNILRPWRNTSHTKHRRQPGHDESLERISQILPNGKSPTELFSIYKQGYKVNEAFRSKHHVEIPIQAWMVQLLRRALAQEPEDSLVEEAIRIIVSARAENAVVFPDSKPLLEKLSKRRIELGIISNVSSHDVAVEILRKAELLEYFDRVVTSAF